MSRELKPGTPQPRFPEVPRVGALGARDFRQYERGRRPVVIGGAVEGWPALTRWSPESLLASFGQERVLARASLRGAALRHRGDPRRTFEYVELSLAEALGEILSPLPDRRLQISHLDLSREVASLSRDVVRPAFCTSRFLSPPLVWFSGPGGVTPMHWDPNMALIVQVFGRKRVVLAPPSDSHHISGAVERHLWRTSGFDPDGPNERRYPGWRGARLLECTLGPAEALFVPYRFWHYASTDVPSISVNFWWEPSSLHLTYDVVEGRLRNVAKGVVRRWGASRSPSE
jgi:ribosomal protein L16 Arg81 hydroxylase